MKSSGGKRTTIIHNTFVVGVVLKGINGLAELAGAAILMFTSPAAVRSLIRTLTFHELSEDPHDVIANFLLHSVSSFSENARLFGVLYLAIHGAVKLFLVVTLLRRKYWAYPAAIIVFGAFIVYQMYQYTISHAIAMVILSAIDAAVIVFTLLEYRTIRQVRPPAVAP
jgi:uncharacterized membrane protein